MNRSDVKQLLDSFISKQRVHWYKPIQIAEILYRQRIAPDSFDILDLESYRNQSKRWRDVVSIELLGRISTSSAKFQDNLFDNNAMPPTLLKELSDENVRTGGAIEAYIYKMFDSRRTQLAQALSYCTGATKESFDVSVFIDSFWREAGLKRSIDKVYEIVVFSLFSTLTDELGLQVKIFIDNSKVELLREFEDFTRDVMRLDFEQTSHTREARIYRVGVTNAADRGLDMYANWGPAIQIKHLTLDEQLAESVVSSIQSDRIVIVCKSAERNLIVSLLNQIGWKSKIQSIITEDNLIAWYEKALRGRFSNEIGNKLLASLAESISEEFPSLEGGSNIITGRNYERTVDEFWR
jgi:type II restriction enzyme